MDYKQELATVQAWLKTTAGLNSWRRTEAPPKLPRPVIVWDSPFRGRSQHLDRYVYEQRVVYYGKLYVSTLDEVLTLQDTLITDLEDRCGVIPLLDADSNTVGYLKDAELEFTDTDGLDVPFKLTYYVSYCRTRPEAPPSAIAVYTRLKNPTGG